MHSSSRRRVGGCRSISKFSGALPRLNGQTNSFHNHHHRNPHWVLACLRKASRPGLGRQCFDPQYMLQPATTRPRAPIFLESFWCTQVRFWPQPTPSTSALTITFCAGFKDTLWCIDTRTLWIIQPAFRGSPGLNAFWETAEIGRRPLGETTLRGRLCKNPENSNRWNKRNFGGFEPVYPVFSGLETAKMWQFSFVGPFLAPSEPRGRTRRAEWRPKHFHTVCLGGTHPYHALGPLNGPLRHSWGPHLARNVR